MSAGAELKLNARRDKATSSSAIAGAKARLKQYTSILDLEQELDLYPTASASAGSSSGSPTPAMWQNAVTSCGSNAFGQINLDLDLMSSSLKATTLPAAPSSSSSSSSSSKSHRRAAACISSVSCGSTLSAAVVDGTCFLWGAGLPGAQLRVPTPLPSIQGVLQVSCGQSHVGLVTEHGQVFTWGAGDHGMLGHGTKTAVATPRVVQALAGLMVSSVSCGAFHTGFVACRSEEQCMTPIPDRDDERDWLRSGSLYMCGMGKAGQLGIDFGRQSSSEKFHLLVPTLVVALNEAGYKVARVSCGFHHTLILALPSLAVRSSFSTAVFACGWGEHGRLGLGDEEQRPLPELVAFPQPFHATEVSAGEQHSLATGQHGCYAWGSNSMGQLGVGSPQATEFALLPMRIPIPEGMQLRQIAAGGRHSAGITACGKVLSWGWGEEGQLGHGSERNSSLPRPCRVPKFRSKAGVPVAVALGMCHTMVLLRNPNYAPPLAASPSPVKPAAPPTPEPVFEPEPEPVPEPEPEPVLEPEPEPPAPSPVAPSPPPRIESPPKSPKADTIRSIRDLLQRREERSLQYQVEVQPPPTPPPEEEPEEPSPTPAPPVEPTQPLPPSPVYLAPPLETPAPAPAPEAKVAIFYRDGQSLDGCLIANSAKRAELRKLKKDKDKVGGGGGGAGKAKPPPSILDRFPRTQSDRL